MRWTGRLVVVAFAALAVVGALDGMQSAPETTRDPVDALVAAWTRARTGTYRAVGTFTRTAPGGRSISAEAEVVQRPPDRLVRQFGEVSGRRDDRALRCPAPLGAGSEAEPSCVLGPAGPDFGELVRREVAAFETLVRGGDPLYVVGERFDGCFHLTRTRDDPRAGYGIEAVLCFDDATGALTEVAIDHGGIEERTVYDRISAQVTDADLAP